MGAIICAASWVLGYFALDPLGIAITPYVVLAFAVGCPLSVLAALLSGGD